jgi:hypothetical protein
MGKRVIGLLVMVTTVMVSLSGCGWVRCIQICQ